MTGRTYLAVCLQYIYKTCTVIMIHLLCIWAGHKYFILITLPCTSWAIYFLCSTKRSIQVPPNLKKKVNKKNSLTDTQICLVVFAFFLKVSGEKIDVNLIYQSHGKYEATANSHKIWLTAEIANLYKDNKIFLAAPLKLIC